MTDDPARLAKWGDFVHPCMDEILAASDISVVEVASENEILKLGDEVDAIFVRTPHFLSSTLINSLPAIRVIAVPGAGLEVVDLAAATERGIPVLHGGGIGASSVAEWTVGAMIWLLRDCRKASLAVEVGDWSERQKTWARRDLGAIKVGIVGFGAIGQKVASIVANAFEGDVSVSDIAPAMLAKARSDGYSTMDLQDLIRSVDILSLHAQVAPGQAPYVGVAELRSMKKGSFLVNSSRGAAVDCEALAASLSSGHLGGAALDVFPVEPPPPGLVSKLLRHDRVLLAPHQAGLTRESARSTTEVVARSVVDVLAGRAVTNCANFP